MKVVKWVPWNSDDDEKNPTLSLREWADVELAIVNDIRDNGYMFAGDTHLSSSVNGVPVVELDDGQLVYFQASMRYWGGIMSRVHCGDYMDFYMCMLSKDKEILPKC